MYSHIYVYAYNVHYTYIRIYVYTYNMYISMYMFHVYAQVIHVHIFTLYGRGGRLGSSTIFKKINQPYAPS